MRTRQVLRETLNKVPRPESVIQNQYLLLEVLCDIRDLVLPTMKEALRKAFDESPQPPWKNLEHSSEPANEEKDDSTVAPFDDEPEQKILKPIDEPI